MAAHFKSQYRTQYAEWVHFGVSNVKPGGTCAVYCLLTCKPWIWIV